MSSTEPIAIVMLKFRTQFAIFIQTSNEFILLCNDVPYLFGYKTGFSPL